MRSKFFFSLKSVKPQEKHAKGSITQVTSDHVPGFENISFSSLKLKKGGAQAPIWHPSSQKVGYCLQGDGLVSMRTPNGVETFTIEKGDIFFIPKGYVHYIANLGKHELSVVFTYNHSKPNMMSVSNAIHSLSGSVFEATFGEQPSFLKGLSKSKKEELVLTLPPLKKGHYPSSNRYKFNIEKSSETVLTKGGYLQATTKTHLSVLNGLGILGFGLNPKGAVEPHWHTNAGELIYIVKGHTRITVLSPEGKTEVMEVRGGEGAFAPASYFHNIENVGKENAEIIAFFNHAEPDYIGIGEVIGAHSNEVLGSIFKVKPSYFETLKKPTGPLVIVPV